MKFAHLASFLLLCLIYSPSAFIFKVQNPWTNIRNYLAQFCKTLNCEIVEAAAHDNGSLSRLLRSEVDVNRMDDQKRTAVIIAAEMGHEKSLSALLKHGAEVEARDDKGQTALLIACKLGHEKCVDVLLRYCADVNTVDDTGTSAARWATRCGHHKCLEMLVDKGVSIDAKEAVWAIGCGHAKCLEVICKSLKWGKGSDSNSGLLNSCAEIGATDCLKVLCEMNTAVDHKDANGRTPAMIACICGHDLCLQVLIDAGADIWLVDDSGETLAALALAYGNYKCLNRLLRSSQFQQEKEATPLWTHAIVEGSIPLLYAAMTGNTGMVKLLIDQGVDVNQADNMGRTPVMLAATRGHEQCLNPILAGGAKINKSDKQGQTALMLAAIHGQRRCVELLLCDGHASVDKVDKGGFTAAMWALAFDHADCLETLLRHGASLKTMSTSMMVEETFDEEAMEDEDMEVGSMELISPRGSWSELSHAMRVNKPRESVHALALQQRPKRARHSSVLKAVLPGRLGRRSLDARRGLLLRFGRDRDAGVDGNVDFEDVVDIDADVDADVDGGVNGDQWR